ncbi:MAG: hypothetical protein KF760_28695 [Candidatus Eremiobacteraeota bacterium]|nr:hypothetical protein [Candidatus Eremiobacteraeota bacterium]MCW5865875.1 hypothetical protein [Candidatus Eremiobacteraeota bacterium]
MSLTIQEAVTTVQTEGPAVTEKLQKMTAETRATQAQVEHYDQALKVLQDGIAQQQALLLKAGQELNDLLAACQSELENEIQMTDETAANLSQFVSSAQTELTAQMGIASQKLQGLVDQMHTLPPALQQAVSQQESVLNQSRNKVNTALGNIKNTVDKAVKEYDSVKTDVVKQQKVMKDHVDVLLTQVKNVHTQARNDSHTLDQASAKVVATFQLNLQEGLQTSVSEPAKELRAGMDQLKSLANNEIDKRLSELVDQILGNLLRAVDKMNEKNEGMLNHLRRYFPDKLNRAAQNLGYVIQNLDLIVRALAEGAVNWVVDWFQKGIDMLSKMTGLKLDFLKQGVAALGEVVKGAVRVSMAPITLARTLVTNPANIWNETQSIITGSRAQAESIGRQVHA